MHQHPLRMTLFPTKRIGALIGVLLFPVLLSIAAYGQDTNTQAPEPTVTIATFNLEVFGVAKASKPQVMHIIADIIRDYDLVAVQEIRDKSGTAIQKLLSLIDSNGSTYKMLLSGREGRTISKEQYAFLYNSRKLQLKGAPYTFDDANDRRTVNNTNDAGKYELFERDPYIAYFRTVAGDFRFVVADIHTKPADATREISYLPLVIADASKHFGEPNVLVIGDFNADGRYFKEDTYTSDFPKGKYIWIIGNNLDTTVAKSSNTYDRMVGTESLAQDYDGKTGTLRFDRVFDLRSLGLKPRDVSDHYPAYAEFYADRDSQ